MFHGFYISSQSHFIVMADIDSDVELPYEANEDRDTLKKSRQPRFGSKLCFRWTARDLFREVCQNWVELLSINDTTPVSN